MDIVLGMPQIIYLFMMILGLGISMANHGKPKSGNESFWVTLVATCISLWLLYSGGFFS